MNDWMYWIEFAVIGGMLALMLLGLVLAAALPGMERESRRYFKILFFDLLLLVIAGLTDMLLYPIPGMIKAERVVWYLESLFIALPSILFTGHLLRCCGEDGRNRRLYVAVQLLWAVFFLLLTLSEFVDGFFSVTSDGQFVREPLYPLLVAPMFVIVFLNLRELIRRKERLTKIIYLAFFLHQFFMLAAYASYIFMPYTLIIELSLTFSALSMFALILFDQISRFLSQQREISRQRARILVLQMRPHFIYNTMTSIYYLCDLDPRKAQRVTMDFTTYLRKNFTAIVSDEPIPFAEELEHTRAYLAVEMAQYDDCLFVDYDTPHTQFRLPPLTLQPIVENAVKHGMDPDAEPLRISIRTRETEEGSVITVENNGLGFSQGDDNEPHIALQNIRQRLEIMCSGRLRILPRPEGGTLVEVTIPGKNP